MLKSWKGESHIDLITKLNCQLKLGNKFSTGYQVRCWKGFHPQHPMISLQVSHTILYICPMVVKGEFALQSRAS